MELSDKQLVENFLEGDDSAFPHLVKRYLKPIYNFLYQLAGDSSALDDLAQETFIKVWKNISRFDQSRSFKVWIFAIAKNTAYDYLKKKKTIPFSVFTNEKGNNKLEKINANEILPDELLEREDFAKELEEKLKKIPEQYRIILLMRYKDDFSLQEIAEIFKKPYNTIKSQHQRALAALKMAFLGE
jgi:RNA polymerase sigma-70 factor, ECF subfamily